MIFSVLVADIYGTNSLELIPAYLLIAETSIGLNKLREAEQQLQKGNVKRAPEISTIVWLQWLNFFNLKTANRTGYELKLFKSSTELVMAG